MNQLLSDIKNCTVCAEHLPHGVNPVVSIHAESKILIIGQAPGSIVHASGIPWDDKSGDNLREWMGINKATFYDSKKFGIVPMGFCYPGKGKSGDLPPRTECAPLWHTTILEQLRNIKLTLLIGSYAQQYYLPLTKKLTLTERVQNFEHYLPEFFVLPHPSPRNNIWKAKNRWFETETLPQLKEKIHSIL